jgi:hypothetical protein
MSNNHHDLTPNEYIKYPARAPVTTHDIIEIDLKKGKRHETAKRNTAKT